MADKTTKQYGSPTEGYWDATVTCSTSGSYTLDAAGNACAYAKIGRLVHVQGQLLITGASSPVGDLQISLPFAAATLTDEADGPYCHCMIKNHGGTIANGVHAVPSAGSAFFNMLSVADDGTVNVLDNTDVDTAFQIAFSFSYIASS